ncbi:MAG TPA: hypothetical protein VHH73_11940 [Verrucomicrobiae bacterium]|nr:hypothetical protein [Verrucomicrobiae bacterium]
MHRISLISVIITVVLGPVPEAIVVRAQPVEVRVSENTDLPQAVVISVHGKCEYSDDGGVFTELKNHHVLSQGAVVRTGDGARADLFFRRVGTTVRLQADTEVKLEKMARSTKDGASTMQTLLDLRKGRIFTAVRSLVPGSTFEIRNAAGRSVVEGSGSGRYIITADGTQVADKTSVVPLKVIGDTGITVIAPGQAFRAKEGKMLPMDASKEVFTFIQFDELDALAEDPTVPPETKPKQREK